MVGRLCATQLFAHTYFFKTFPIFYCFSVTLLRGGWTGGREKKGTKGRDGSIGVWRYVGDGVARLIFYFVSFLGFWLG